MNDKYKIGLVRNPNFDGIEYKRFSKKFPVEYIVKEIGQLYPVSHHYMLTGSMPKESELVQIHPFFKYLCYPKVYNVIDKTVAVGIYGAGKRPFFNEKTKEVAKGRLKEYLEKIDIENQTLSLFITPIHESIPFVSFVFTRPMGGQLKEYAEWDLEFSNKLSNNFEYEGAYFTPTVAVIGFDKKSKEALKQIADPDVIMTSQEFILEKDKSIANRFIYNPEDVVQEYKLIPIPARVLKSFVEKGCKDFVEKSPVSKSQFMENFKRSLYNLALLPLNTTDKNLNYLDLGINVLYNFEDAISNHSIVGEEGKVYYCSLDKMSIASKKWSWSCFKKEDRECILENVTRCYLSQVFNYISTAHKELNGCVLSLEELLEDFAKHTQSTKTKLIDYQIEKNPDNSSIIMRFENESISGIWNFSPAISYYHHNNCYNFEGCNYGYFV